MITNIKTKGLKEYFTNHVKQIVNKLSLNKFYKENAEVYEIDEEPKELFVTVNNDGQKCFLSIPKTAIGNNRDEDIFVSKLIEHAQ